MSTYPLDAILAGPASRFIHLKQENQLSTCTEELAGLRFSIILTAKWEASSDEDSERRNELRTELADLRRRYSNKIDEIAMNFGVQNAIDAKNEVEQTVAIPLGMDLCIKPIKDDCLYF